MGGGGVDGEEWSATIERQGGRPGAGVLEGSEVQRFAGRRESRNSWRERFLGGGGGCVGGWLVVWVELGLAELRTGEGWFFEAANL